MGATSYTEKLAVRCDIRPSIRRGEQRAWTLMQFPREVLVLVLCWLDVRSLLRFASTCMELHCQQMIAVEVEEALRMRAARRGHVNPVRKPDGTDSWVVYLDWLERRREEACMPVAAGASSSFFLVDDGCLVSCGEGEVMAYLATAKLSTAKTMCRYPPCFLRRRTSTSAGFLQRSASPSHFRLQARCTLGALAEADYWVHSDEQHVCAPMQIEALCEHEILAVAAGGDTGLAVTEGGEVFMWGKDVINRVTTLLPVRIASLAGVRARSASVGDRFCLVVTEDGTSSLWSFNPKMVCALHHVRIVAAAAGSRH